MQNNLKMKFGLIPNNMGDMLNTMIPKDLFGVNIEHVNNIYQCNTTGIGSYLGDFFKSKDDIKLKEKIKGIVYAPSKPEFVKIWSTGFMDYSKGKEVSVRKLSEVKIASVRGNLSKERLENIVGHKLDITTGDAGLLANKLISNVEKKYEIGIIPHFREKNEPIFEEASNFYKNSKFIDLGENPYEVIRNIGECEYIISSSLHGLIVADSFNIPNIRITKTNNMFGDGFKFDDYYSSFGLSSKKIHLESIKNLPKFNTIVDNYKITSQMILDKQEQIEKAFYEWLK